MGSLSDLTWTVQAIQLPTTLEKKSYMFSLSRVCWNWNRKSSIASTPPLQTDPGALHADLVYPYSGLPLFKNDFARLCKSWWNSWEPEEFFMLPSPAFSSNSHALGPSERHSGRSSVVAKARLWASSKSRSISSAVKRTAPLTPSGSSTSIFSATSAFFSPPFLGAVQTSSPLSLFFRLVPSES